MKQIENIDINDYDYPLPEERIAKYPLTKREESKLLLYDNGTIHTKQFSDILEQIPRGNLLIFNNTKVIRARIVMQKETGARVEIFCLEPHLPSDYERAFSIIGECEWSCIVGNSKKWKTGALSMAFEHHGKKEWLKATKKGEHSSGVIIRFEWGGDLTFGKLLELLGRMPIPPYLQRESEESDSERYQTVYSKFEGSVAAPTAGLHFTDELLGGAKAENIGLAEVTLHVGAGTFLPVKEQDATKHHMHTEHFTISAETLEKMIAKNGQITAVGTTTVRTLESLVGLGWRVANKGEPEEERPVGQWELYEVPEDVEGVEMLRKLLEYMIDRGETRLNCSTQIMIVPGFRFRVVGSIITNFHQPKSTLLLLVSAFIGDDWRGVYGYALENDFRFLSYGDSSLLMRRRWSR